MEILSLHQVNIAGDTKGFNAYSACIEHHNGNSSTLISRIVKKSLSALKIVFNYDVSEYVSLYNPSRLLDYIWITHETDSFFGILDNKLDVSISSIPNIRLRKTNKIELTVTTTGSKLQSTNLSTYNLKSANNKIKINNVKYINFKYDGFNTYTYKYEIEIKGTSVGSTSIYLKDNVFKLENNNFTNPKIQANTFRVTF